MALVCAEKLKVDIPKALLLHTSQYFAEVVGNLPSVNVRNINMQKYTALEIQKLAQVMFTGILPFIPEQTTAQAEYLEYVLRKLVIGREPKCIGVSEACARPLDGIFKAGCQVTPLIISRKFGTEEDQKECMELAVNAIAMSFALFVSKQQAHPPPDWEFKDVMEGRELFQEILHGGYSEIMDNTKGRLYG